MHQHPTHRVDPHFFLEALYLLSFSSMYHRYRSRDMLSLQLQHSQDYFWPLLIISISSLTLILYFLTKCHFLKFHSNSTQPPSPPKLPILGNLHQVGRLTHRSLRYLGGKYGPLMLLHFGIKPVIVVQSADAAMEIMKKQDLSFADKPNTRATRIILYNLKDISITPYGEYWRKLKSLCVLQLLSKKRVQSFHFIREEETALLVNRITVCCSSGLSVNLSQMFTSLTNDIVCRSTFGRKYSETEHGKKFLELMGQLPEILGYVSIGDFIPSLWWVSVLTGFDARVDNIAKEIDAFLDQIIEEHLISGNENGENFLSILLEIYKENMASIDKDNVKAIMLNLILGGTDSTSATLEWAMTELIRHPIVMKKLQQEVREVMEEKEQEIITDNDLDKMKYLKAVVKETLRYHLPLAFLARVAREDVKVEGYEILKGTLVLINAWAIGRDPAYWDEPEEFKPERFLNCSMDVWGLDFEYIPFGAGRRQCPGISFAKVNVELVLANMVRNFKWDLPGGMKNEDLDTKEHPGITIHRRNPLIVVPTYC